ncbi:uncharacterized protein DUF1648 [Halopolyspora algeriensis]|uniref:Uncharacterized protein DUF1648 n=1 Tax=Halopolyspora algeriensis TaxID=1500506 RepID=A0A368VGI0_9ACTN|nr:DUF1648 domain-containing protein [Halopolyspora algeriensis]RCW40267.1 uncharacterized protein DUF1648 [Halopolyspora algeriensis]TQM46252.1 uncharacterized protein DUF1648 [Halopolyspora algeriensis]
MTFRTRFFLFAGLWTTLVTGFLAGLPLALRERLPAPIAVHWGVSGEPDNAMPLWGLILLSVALWLLLAGAAVAAVRGGVRQRQRRAWLGASLVWGGVFVACLMLLTVWANLDAGSWSQARSVTWQAAPLIATPLLAGWLGWLLARRGPDESSESDRPAPTLRLRPDEKAVWVSSSGTGTGLVSAALACLSVAVVVAVLMGLGMVSSWATLLVFALVGLVCLAVSTVRVRITEQGLSIAFGPLGRPVRRIPLHKIDSARMETRRPSEVGGWGIRGLPGRSTIMIRAGECLVVRYTSGGELGISVDDAERGAALLNTLVGRTRTTEPQENA